MDIPGYNRDPNHGYYQNGYGSGQPAGAVISARLDQL